MTLHCVALHSKAGADQISDEPCLRLALPRFASLCLRQALLLKATPSLPVSVHRRCMPRLCFAVALCRAALRCGAVAVRGSSWPSYPMPLRVGPLPVLRGSVRFLATPSPLFSKLRLSFAERGSAVHFHRLTEQIKAFPSPSLASHFLRSSRLSRASPSPGCATPCSSLPSLA